MTETLARPQPAGARSVSGDASVAQFGNDDLLKLLVAIRGSSIPDDTRTELRDLILEYAQLEDENARVAAASKLDAALAPYRDELAPVLPSRMAGMPTPVSQHAAQEGTSSATAAAQLGRTRRAPSFGDTTASEQQDSGVDEAPRTDGQTSAPQPAPADPSQRSDTSRTTPPPRPEAPRDPAPAPEHDAPQEAEEKSEPQPQQTTARPAATDVKARIAEIKRSVNEAVGNPVNLIEQDRAVGQEYMAALLDAIKRTAPGQAGADAALERLEQAYALVQELLRRGQSGSPSATAADAPEREDTPVPEQKTSSFKSTSSDRAESVQLRAGYAPVPDTDAAPNPSPAATNAAASQEADTSSTRGAAEQPQAESHAEPMRPTPAPEPRSQPNTQKQRPSTAPDQHTSIPIRTEVQRSAPAARTTTSPAERSATTPQRSGAASPTSAQRLASLADVKRTSTKPQPDTTASEHPPQPQQQSSEEGASAVAPHAAAPQQRSQLSRSTTQPRADVAPGAGLHTPEIDAGLEQLLSEWKLFKKSGFLGTGPNGTNHPLYKKLAGLPMAAVVAGRFEGATPEVKQTITDYMNGWRYEQGIVHRMDEQFEHYLRRVIKHIMDKQKQQQPPQAAAQREQ